MKKLNKEIQQILRDYYSDIAVIKVWEKNIYFLRKGTNEQCKEKIEILSEKIENLKEKNKPITLAIEGLDDELKLILKYKFALKYDNRRMMTELGYRETKLWKKQNYIYEFLNTCLSVEEMIS